MDSSRDAVQHARDFISHAIIGDAANKEVLESLALRDFDGAIISIGQDMGASILISLYIKGDRDPADHRARHIRGPRQDSAHDRRDRRHLPRKDMAVRVANKLALKKRHGLPSHHRRLRYHRGHAAEELRREIAQGAPISTRFGCQIIGLKYPPPEGVSSGIDEKNYKIKIAPTAHDVISADAI